MAVIFLAGLPFPRVSISFSGRLCKERVESFCENTPSMASPPVLHGVTWEPFGKAGLAWPRSVPVWGGLSPHLPAMPRTRCLVCSPHATTFTLNADGGEIPRSMQQALPFHRSPGFHSDSLFAATVTSQGGQGVPQYPLPPPSTLPLA